MAPLIMPLREAEIVDTFCAAFGEAVTAAELCFGFSDGPFLHHSYAAFERRLDDEA